MELLGSASEDWIRSKAIGRPGFLHADNLRLLLQPQAMAPLPVFVFVLLEEDMYIIEANNLAIS